MATLSIAVIVGSARRESINRKLARALVKLAGDSAVFSFVQIDDLPMFNQDIEKDAPASVARFKAAVSEADGVLFVTPEHNRSMPALLKNAIDWGTRPYGQNDWAGKPAAITGASQGAISTAVAQGQLRQIMSGLGCIVAGGETYINFKPGLVDDNGDIGDESVRGFLAAFIERFLALAARLH